MSEEQKPVKLVYTGGYYVGVDEASGKIILVPKQAEQLFFGNYLSEHVLEVGTEHYREMQDWYQDGRCYRHMTGVNRFGIVVIDPVSVAKHYKGEAKLTLEEARNEGQQSPYAQALGWLSVVLLSDGSYDWFPTVHPPFPRNGGWDHDARVIERWSMGKGATWVQVDDEIPT